MNKEVSPRRGNAEGSNHQPKGTEPMTKRNVATQRNPSKKTATKPVVLEAPATPEVPELPEFFTAWKARTEEDAVVLRRDLDARAANAEEATLEDLLVDLSGGGDGGTIGVAAGACYLISHELGVIAEALSMAAGRGGLSDPDFQRSVRRTLTGASQRLRAAAEIETRRLRALRGEGEA